MFHRMEFTAHGTNLRWMAEHGVHAVAMASGIMDIAIGDRYSIELGHPLSGSAADLHRLELWDIEELPNEGWVTCKASYQYNWMSGGAPRPLTFYVGHPTDWPSGLVSFSVPVQESSPTPPYGFVQGPVFTIAARRMP
jgi:hypothetical protein